MSRARSPVLAFAFALALFLMVFPFAQGADHPSFTTSVTTAQMQEVVDGITATPQVQSGLSEGDVIVLRVGDNAWHGAVSGGHAAMSEGDAAGTAVLTMSADVARSLANSYDRGNTARLVIQKHFFAIDGSAKVKAAGNAIYSGRFDSQLAAVALAAGQSVSFGGYSGVLQASGDHFLVRLGDANFLVNSLGAIYAQAPDDRFLALAGSGAGAALRVFDSGTFSLASDLIDSGGSSGEDEEAADACQSATNATGSGLLSRAASGAATHDCVHGKITAKYRSELAAQRERAELRPSAAGGSRGSSIGTGRIGGGRLGSSTSGSGGRLGTATRGGS